MGRGGHRSRSPEWGWSRKVAREEECLLTGSRWPEKPPLLDVGQHKQPGKARRAAREFFASRVLSRTSRIQLTEPSISDVFTPPKAKLLDRTRRNGRVSPSMTWRKPSQAGSTSSRLSVGAMNP